MSDTELPNIYQKSFEYCPTCDTGRQCFFDEDRSAAACTHCLHFVRFIEHPPIPAPEASR